ncbi:MAG: hypothetical protein WCG60_00160 [bacterium]|jgi:hypothetical protein
MKLHVKLPPKYGEFMSQLKGQTILGIKITDSLILEGLAMVAWGIATEHSPKEAVRRIENLVLANLAGMWTFKFLNDPRYPNYSSGEATRWHLGHYSDGDDPTETEDGRYLMLQKHGVCDFDNINTLNIQLGERIGKCSTYAITLGVILCVCDLVDGLELVGAQGHAWVYCRAKGANDYQHIDLSLRSHGELEEDKEPNHYRNLMDDPCTLIYNLLDL